VFTNGAVFTGIDRLSAREYKAKTTLDSREYEPDREHAKLANGGDHDEDCASRA
jgi:hypothetical protein